MCRSVYITVVYKGLTFDFQSLHRFYQIASLMHALHVCYLPVARVQHVRSIFQMVQSIPEKPRAYQRK